MKKSINSKMAPVLVSAVWLAMTPGLAMAQTTSIVVPTANAKSEARQATNITNLKTRGDAEIDRRVTFLNGLISRLNDAKKLDPADKSALTGQVQNYINELTALKAKIDADTDITALRADVKSIVDSYRVYLLFAPKTAMASYNDRLQYIVSQFNDIETKLNTHIQNAQTKGHDVTQLGSLMSDIKTQLANATSLGNQAVAEVTPLDPSDYPGNKSTLLDGKAKLQQAHQDIEQARKDVNQIVTQLKAWNTSAKPSATPMPSGMNNM